ncbi:MAG TPA: carboxypeptidase-like regulatory domain-containing protein [Kofleriaceae bacterium]|nr:carboxypeptidase-like regulatory domain-containing protein [Kofleriaceae bacterium]
MNQNITCCLVLALAASGCMIGDEREPGARGPVIGAAGGLDLYGINVATTGPGGEAVRELGASWTRIELVDGTTGAALSDETRDRLAAALADYHAAGIRVLLIVNYSSHGGFPGFYDCGGVVPGGDWQGWRDGFVERVRTVATTFGDQIDAWEVWNEEDHPALPCGEAGYNPHVPAGDYGVLLRDTYGAIRSGSTAPVVVGGLDSGQVSYVHEASAAAGGLFADAVGIHPYGVPPAASWCPDPGEDLNCEWGTFASKVIEYGDATGVPVWLTEFGLRSEDLAHQADYVEGSYRALAALGDRVGPGFYFCYSDAMVPPFGLTFADGAPKTAPFTRYQQLARAIDPPGGGGGGGGGGGMASRLHGTVEIGGAAQPGLVVTAWGHLDGDLHEATTDALGIYALEGLRADSLYNVVVNARFGDGGFAPIDGSHAFEVRDNVALTAGPDDWHGEDFQLAE